MSIVDIVNYFFSFLVVVGQIAVIAWLISLAMNPKVGNPAFRFFTAHADVLAFIVVALAVIGSLTYSEIIGYEPCKLCWFQRIFMYPQLIILGWNLLKKERAAFVYSLSLSTIGIVIAGYHYLLQLGIVPAGSCGAVGYSVSCAQRFVMNFGYITIPMMAFTAFALLICVSWSFLMKEGK